MAVFDQRNAEAGRLDALRRFGIVDSEPEPELEVIAQRAADACAAPIALVTFVTETKQWVKAAVGADWREMDRDISFCTWAVHNAQVLCIEDASQDDRFRDNPLVVQAPFIRYYAGAPIPTPEGFLLGAVCIIDHQPRSPQAEHLKILEACAQEVSSVLIRRAGAGQGLGA